MKAAFTGQASGVPGCVCDDMASNSRAKKTNEVVQSLPWGGSLVEVRQGLFLVFLVETCPLPLGT